MNIQPISRSINQQECVEWIDIYQDLKIKYDDFMASMLQQGHKKEEINNMWLYNYGAIPPCEPDRFYYCNILEPNLKITLTVIRRNNILEGEKKFEVVKLNHLFLDSYDYIREFVIKNGKLTYITTYEDLTTLENNLEDSNYPLNYNDGNWFKALAIDGLLSKFKLRIGKSDLSPDIYMTNNDGLKFKLETGAQHEDEDLPTVYAVDKDGSKFILDLTAISDTSPITGTDEDGTKFKFKEDIVENNSYVYVTDFDAMETTNMVITDKEFEKKLYELIESRFQKIDSQLR